MFLAALTCWGLVLNAAPSEASFGKIDRLAGNPALRGDRSGYNITLTLTKPSVELTAHTATDNATANSGTKIIWSVANISTGATNATHTFNPGEDTPLDTNGRAKVTIQFANAQLSDKFRITAELKDAGGTTVGANATVEISFAQAIELAGVSLNESKLTVRQNREGLYLTATPTPNNATNVAYVWSSQNQDVVTPVQESLSPDMARLTVAQPGTAKIIVTATGENGTTATASCDITVVGKGEIADDMVIAPIETGDWKPLDEEKSSTILYGVDESYIGTLSGALTSDKIKTASGITTGGVYYLIGSNPQKASYYINRTMITSAHGLNISDFDTRVVAAMRFEADFSPSTVKGNMIPMMLSFNLANLLYPDGRTPVANSSSVADFHNNYRIMKYFERGTANYAIEISDVLSRRMGTYMVRDTTTGEFRLGPLVVMVDALAPLDNWCDAYAGENNQYGVKYDNTNNILFIYDGNPNAKIEDPIVLEKRPQHYSGGGGGGCSAGAGIFALIALAGVAIVRMFRD
ncbi:hypothetical protein LJC31_03190 [Synergistaceae bacterium OttesenSCG-928-I11]|nr:hypothetical protein [Synergistaceae bacterium OttesenSCG-928-I11]